MDVKLDNLIEKIKQEGVDKGRQAADQLIKDAENKSVSILGKAKEDAEKIIADAQKQAGQFQQNSELALQQAARDSELLLKSRITDLLDRVFKKEVADTLTPEVLKEMILKLVEGWDDTISIETILSKEDSQKLENILFAGVQKSLKDKIELRAGSEVSHGFRIGLKGQDVYYDFTEDAIAGIMKQFLKPQLKDILDASHG